MAPASPGSSAKPEEMIAAALTPALPHASSLRGDELCRNDQDGEIDLPRAITDRRISLEPLHLAVAAADRIDRPGVGVQFHELENAAAKPLAERRSADHGHALGVQQGPDVTFLLHVAHRPLRPRPAAMMPRSTSVVPP